jgi:hypothetical protein
MFGAPLDHGTPARARRRALGRMTNNSTASTTEDQHAVDNVRRQQTALKDVPSTAHRSVRRTPCLRSMSSVG